MDADFSVELGAGDDALELPWSSPDGAQRFYDLKRQPDLILYVPEAAAHPELSAFLAAMNRPSSAFFTAKCDVWPEAELTPAEDIYGASVKFASYIDLLLESPIHRFSFEQHERLARRACSLLALAPEIPAAAEFTIRRCYFHSTDEPVRPGFYITYYQFGYGDDDVQARKNWTVALDLVRNALLQISAEMQGSIHSRPS